MKKGFQQTCVFSDSEPLCQMLDRAGVPPDPKWRTLILYMRGLEHNEFLTEQQKVRIQALVVKTLKEKDFSDAKYSELLSSEKEILDAPCNRKLEAALAETAAMVGDFKVMLQHHKGDVERLGNKTATVIAKGGDTDSLIAQIKEAFTEVVSMMQRDAETLTQLSKTDGLTGLNNRRAFDEHLDDSIEQWKQYDGNLALLMMDIDHFKKFNDSYGHRIGDQALATVAKILRGYGNELQDRDDTHVNFFPARYGGEEFAVVLRGATESSAMCIGEEIRRRVMRYNFLIRGVDGDVIKRGIHITLSVGVSEMSPEWKGAFAENLIEFADKALYKAKAAGRNLVLSNSGLELEDALDKCGYLTTSDEVEGGPNSH